MTNYNRNDIILRKRQNFKIRTKREITASKMKKKCFGNNKVVCGIRFANENNMNDKFHEKRQVYKNDSIIQTIIFRNTNFLTSCKTTSFIKTNNFHDRGQHFLNDTLFWQTFKNENIRK